MGCSIPIEHQKPVTRGARRMDTPKLTEEQKRIVAKDYGMKNFRLHVAMRSAMLYHFLRRMNLDFEEEKRPAQEQHVVLANGEEVRDALEKAHIT